MTDQSEFVNGARGPAGEPDHTRETGYFRHPDLTNHETGPIIAWRSYTHDYTLIGTPNPFSKVPKRGRQPPYVLHLESPMPQLRARQVSLRLCEAHSVEATAIN